MTDAAYRTHRDGEVVYIMPFEVAGRRVVYRQDPTDFDTHRGTVTREQARTLVENGRSVALYETPAWADPDVPATVHATTRPA